MLAHTIVDWESCPAVKGLPQKKQEPGYSPGSVVLFNAFAAGDVLRAIVHESQASSATHRYSEMLPSVFHERRDQFVSITLPRFARSLRIPTNGIRASCHYPDQT
jgi:hypothetical protein